MAGGAPTVDVPTPLVGRRSELARLEVLLADAAQGSGRIAMIQGEAGIGKTRLLDEVVNGARASGFRILRGGAEEFDQQIPFASICRAVEIVKGAPDERGEIARLISWRPDVIEGDSVLEGPSGLEHPVAEAILGLIEREAMAQPLVLVMEDLQWVDASTILVLHRLASQISQYPAALITSARPVPRGEGLDRLVRSFESRGSEGMALGPLDEMEVVELLRGIVDGTPGPSLIKQAAAAGGNPFFVIEMLAALTQADAIQVADDGTLDATTVSQPVPISVTILHRLSFLTRETLDVLRVASILGSTFDVADLATVTRRSPADLIGVIDECTRAGVLRPDDARLAFRHDLIRSALYEDLPAAMRRALHSETGVAFAAAGKPPQEVAEHFIRGASPGDERALEWLEKAALDASMTAPAVAAELLAHGLAIVDPTDVRRSRLLADRAVNLMWAGRMTDAEAVCRDALSRAHPPAIQARFRECLAFIALAQGRAADSLTEGEAALATGELDEATRIRLHGMMAQALMFSGRQDEALERAAKATAEADRLGDAFGHCIAAAASAGASWFKGELREAAAIASDAVRKADQSPGQLGHRFHISLLHGAFLADADDIEGGLAAIRHGREITEATGARWNLSYYHYASAMVRFLAGAWDDAQTDLETAVETGEEHGTGHGVMGSSIRSMIALHRGDLSLAEEMAAAAEREFLERGPSFRADWMGWARGLVLEAYGKPEEAAAVLGGTWDLCTALGLHCEYRILGPDLVRLALLTGDRDRAAAATHAVEELAAMAPGVASLEGTASLCRGLLDSDERALRVAVDSFDRSPRRRDAAVAREAAGTALSVLGRKDEAAAMFAAARSGYEGLDAARDIARVLEALRSIGVRPGVQGQRGRPKFGWDALTQTEGRVAKLVADGLSNQQIGERLFISRYTVKTHVAHILGKLEIRSRTELAAMIARRKD